ncbi:MAG: hypothetical protein ABJN26_21315 [Stappiaceae bacterium]
MTYLHPPKATGMRSWPMMLITAGLIVCAILFVGNAAPSWIGIEVHLKWPWP